MLAFLIPGAGHYYQGRKLKAGIFFSGILTLFFGGMILADWQPVYSQVVYNPRDVSSVQVGLGSSDYGTHFSLGYAAQAAVGLPALPALLQQSRLSGDPGVVTSLSSDLESRFSGVAGTDRGGIPVSGRIRLSPGPVGSGVGQLTGVTRKGVEFEIEISGTVKLGREVFGSPHKFFEMNGMSGAEIDGKTVRRLEGSIDRSFFSWYQAPRDNQELDRLHNKLSHLFDIGAVFTWIAGLLNVMAIWDAYDGPAYGYGDEEPEEDAGQKKPAKESGKERASATAAVADS